MDSGKTTTQTANTQREPNDGVQPHPELLMAARHGDRDRLKRILRTVSPASRQPVALPAGEVVLHVEEVDDDDTQPAAVVTSAEAVTVALDSVLHVVASSGDEPMFLESATVIHGRASHLLDAGNKKGDTPLHCAARAGRVRMVSHLLDLARGGGGVTGGDAAARAVARRQNNKGETALHEAVRLNSKAMVEVLMSADPELARVVPADGESPLYLAVSLGRRDDIARLLHQHDKGLSYAGPDGKNALHAAVQKDKDRHRGSTPVHVAASWGHHDVISLLLDADPSAAYQPDHDGAFPIHVAAYDGQVRAVSILLELDNRKCRDLTDCAGLCGERKRRDHLRGCAELRDGRGRSFLHVAVQEQRQSLVAYACKLGNLSPAVMNMQDDDGNTALHLAVQVGNLWIFNFLMQRRQVELNLTNNKGQTPVDISWIEKPVGVYFGLNQRIKIYKLLKGADAKEGNHRWDLFLKQHNKKVDEEVEGKKLTESTQTIGIGSVLIATVAFAAAFAPPGDYGNEGTPRLAGSYAFDVFIIANTLAFICSGLSVISLTYAGVAAVDLRTRMFSFVFSASFMACSARSLGVAFAFGMYVVLAPVARTTAIAACVITGLALVDVGWFVWGVAACEVMLLKRLGIARAWWRLPCAIMATLLMQFWPYIVIVVVVLYSKIRGVH
uniref:PGG domain-containing protein n=1 Tax=Oryza punctata TaxID=4537 RepID=A0A0E0LZZ3_ORYPU